MKDSIAQMIDYSSKEVKSWAAGSVLDEDDIELLSFMSDIISQYGKPPKPLPAGTKHIASFADGVSCHGFIQHDNRIYVGTSNGVYFINENDELELLKFKEER